MSPLAATEAVATDDKGIPSDQRALLQDVLAKKGTDVVWVGMSQE
jgi:hypothetical protein